MRLRASATPAARFEGSVWRASSAYRKAAVPSPVVRLSRDNSTCAAAARGLSRNTSLYDLMASATSLRRSWTTARAKWASADCGSAAAAALARSSASSSLFSVVSQLRFHHERRCVVRHARQQGIEPLMGSCHPAFGVVQRRQPRLSLGKRRRVRRERRQQARGVLGAADVHVVVGQLKTGGRRLGDVSHGLEGLLCLLGSPGREVQHAQHAVGQKVPRILGQCLFDRGLGFRHAPRRPEEVGERQPGIDGRRLQRDRLPKGRFGLLCGAGLHANGAEIHECLAAVGADLERLFDLRDRSGRIAQRRHRVGVQQAEPRRLSGSLRAVPPRAPWHPRTARPEATSAWP